ncbi:hexaprenyldihydroxybenzoate methyltransferase [Macrolepiota fuliginosa MF-IS2]|uniref:Hexaprenyldihydroxybenzoate methyltransferase n=1 Tax=Macrolepiota fuliginosa MF-IS2 TaxID=1400762 RepID=A0A9P6C6I4_9AGAR|nr:hexaprenyldihydroxybenzoate methyltransferase [Macrolepiota fuliginosa MF-IS2]
MATNHHDHDHHDQQRSVLQANKEYFNQPHNTYEDKPEFKERATRVAKSILKSYATNKETTVVLDFACGNGNVSKDLAPHVKSVLGVDVSQRMVDLYNEQLKDIDNASAVCMELKAKEGELSDARFDMIFCASAYHHFVSIEDVTRTLTFFLKPGGALMVVDIVHSEEVYASMAERGHIVPHKHGLSREQIHEAFAAAGLSMKLFESIPPSVEHPSKDLFLAVGERPSV